MKIEQRKYKPDSGWEIINSEMNNNVPQLVLVFGSGKLVSDKNRYEEIRSFYPKSNIILSSTSGEILVNEVADNTIVLCAMFFEKSTLEFKQVKIDKFSESEDAGRRLSAELPKDKLIHAMIFSDGLSVNGTALVKGVSSNLPPHVSITGGLAGDGSAFKNTYVGLNSVASPGKIIIVGFYGDSLKVGYGSFGGWDSFGSKRMVTKSEDNILYELDNKPALALYKEYLGDKAGDLPGSGLLFPLSMTTKTDNGQDVEIVRTVLAVNENNQSVVFAGDIPQGHYVRLMKADFDRIIDGATDAANMSMESLSGGKAEIGILISCVGRKLVLKERVDEEIEGVRNILGEQARIVGFYSYGEICPTAPTEKQCQLHNQTMTITTFREE